MSASLRLPRSVQQGVRVGELSQHRIVTSWLEEFCGTSKDWVYQRHGVPDVQIKGNQMTFQVQLGIVIQWSAAVIPQTLLKRPRNDVAQSVEVQVQIQRDRIIHAEVFVVNAIPMNKTEAERDDLSVLSPDEKSGSIRHFAA